MDALREVSIKRRSSPSRDGRWEEISVCCFRLLGKGEEALSIDDNLGIEF